MKTITKEIIQAALGGFILPAVLLLAAMAAGSGSTVDTPEPTLTGVRVTLPQATKPPEQTTMEVLLPVLSNGETRQMDVEEYLLGVLLAEMPAAFETDALRAQAVAARTYALKCIAMGYKHDGAICTEYSCCQGYLSPEDYLAKGGTQESVDKICAAVQATAGEVLVYNGELIMATYFDCSGGSTENASAVWGQDYPYLQAVESPGEEYAANYSDEKTFSALEFQAALGVRLNGDPRTWFGEVTYTPGKGVDTILIGGVSYRGTTLRTLLGLRSTVFTVSVTEDCITFATKGHGHRVGMSQYGADAMAMTGCDYQQILVYYYQGTEIVEYSQIGA